MSIKFQRKINFELITLYILEENKPKNCSISCTLVYLFELILVGLNWTFKGLMRIRFSQQSGWIVEYKFIDCEVVQL